MDSQARRYTTQTRRDSLQQLKRRQQREAKVLPFVQKETVPALEATPEDIYEKIAETYGPEFVEYFKKYQRDHADLPIEEVWKQFEAETENHYTGWFRETNLEVIADEVIPFLIQERKDTGSIAILEVGCSGGEESYSLSAAMIDAGHEDFSITAVDINPELLEQGRKAAYPYYLGSGSFDASFRKGYFEFTGRKDLVKELGQLVQKPTFQPRKDVQEKVTFVDKDILREPIDRTYDVILINNVLFHYTPEARNQMIQKLLRSLKPDGFLVMERIDRKRREEDYMDWRKNLDKQFPLEEFPVKVSKKREGFSYNKEYYRFRGMPTAERDFLRTELP